MDDKTTVPAPVSEQQASATQPPFSHRLVASICAKAWWVIALAVILAVGGLYLTTTRLGYLSSTNDLIRQDAPFHKVFLSYFKEFNVTCDLVILSKAPSYERNKECLSRMNQLFYESGQFQKIFYRLDFTGLEKRFLLYLPTSDLVAMERDLGSFLSLLSSSGKPVLDLNSMLAQANSMFDEKYLRKEENWDEFKPFVDNFVGSLNGLASQLENPAAPGKVPSMSAMLGMKGDIAELDRIKRENEFISYNEGRAMMMLLTPKMGDPQAMSPFADSIATARRVIAQMRQEYPDVQIGLTGEPVLDADQIESSMKSVAVASVITFILISLLLIFSYHEFSRPMLALGVLVVATLWTLGLCTLTVGHLNIISNAFVAMILGLGIDFGVQLIGRYEEEIAGGHGVLEALQRAVSHTGSAIFTGAVTTSAAFYTMCFNDFAGLTELGLIAGSGVLLCMVADLTVLPACIWLRDRNRADVQKTVAPNHWRGGILMKEPFAKRPWVIVGVAGSLTALAFVGIPKVGFDYNLLNLQNPKLESVQVELDLLSSKGLSTVFAAVVADDLEQARKMAEELKKLPSVQSVAGLTELIPPGQEEKLAVVRRITGRLNSVKLDTDVSRKIDVMRARRELGALLQSSIEAESQARKYAGISKRARDARDTFAKLIPALDRAHKAMRTLSQEEAGRRLNTYQLALFGELSRVLKWLAAQQSDRPITPEDIPPDLRSKFIGSSGKILLQVFPKENVWERAPLERFVKDVRSIAPSATGTPIQNYEYLAILKNAFQQAGLYSIGVIVVALLIHFRSLRLTLLTLVPLGLAILWVLGVMPLLKLQFNPANIITLPLVIGIGVAYGIYGVDRFRENPHQSLFETSTAKSVWLSALTTIIGFASLMQSTYRGISSLGLLMSLGVTFCVMTGLYVLPSLLRLAAAPPASPAPEAAEDESA